MTSNMKALTISTEQWPNLFIMLYPSCSTLAQSSITFALLIVDLFLEKTNGMTSIVAEICNLITANSN